MGADWDRQRERLGQLGIALRLGAMRQDATCAYEAGRRGEDGGPYRAASLLGRTSSCNRNGQNNTMRPNALVSPLLHGRLITWNWNRVVALFFKKSAEVSLSAAAVENAVKFHAAVVTHPPTAQRQARPSRCLGWLGVRGGYSRALIIPAAHYAART